MTTLSGVALTVSFRGSSTLTSAALIAGDACPVVTRDTISCSSISWITTEDLGGCIGRHASLFASEMNSDEAGVPGLDVLVNSLCFL